MIYPELFSYEDVNVQAESLSEAIAVALMKDVQEKREALLVLPGGSSPRVLISWLAQKDIPWDKVKITVTDERCVAIDHEHSNIGQVIRLFSEQGRAVNAVPMWDEGKKDLSSLPWPATAVVLGMGGDGHTASLFPGQEWGDGNEMVIEARAPFDPPQRLSFTLERLTKAENLILLVNGVEKWDVYQRIVKGEYRGTPLEKLVQTAGDFLQVHAIANDSV